MKARALSLALLLFAGAAGAASAQDQDQDHHRGERRGQGHAPREQPPQAQPPQGQAPQAPQPAQAPPAPQPGAGRHGGEGHGGWRPQDGGRFGGGQPRPDDRSAPAPQPRPQGEVERHSGWSRDQVQGQRPDWNRNGPGRYEGSRSAREAPRWAPHQYPQRYRSEQRYRAPAWHAPRGYYSRAWRFGEILPRGWYGRDYWIPIWWEFDLPMPPPGYHWVRIGYDALLVDDFDGRIVQVVEDLFW